MRHNISEVTSIIRDRRTIYPEFFGSRKVHREQIELMLNNAIWAPTHGMTQPWRFKVHMEEALGTLALTLGEMYTEFAGAQFNEMKHAKILRRPGLSSAVIVVGMTPDPKGRIPNIEEAEAVACAVQNMHLTATAQGLAFMWSSPKFLYDKTNNIALGFADEDSVLGLLYIGYPDGDWPKGQRKPIEYVTEWFTQ